MFVLEFSTGKEKTYGWKVFFRGRRTATLVRAKNRSQAITKARESKVRGGDKVMSAARLTPDEEKQAAQGKWVKTRPPGFKESMKGQGPKPKAYSK